MWPLWRKTLVSRAFLYISFRIPSKGALPPGFSHRAPIERDTVFSALFYSLLKSPGKRTSPPGPPTRPLWRDAPFQSLLLHIASSPDKKGLLIKQNLTFLSNSPVKEPFSLFYQGGPYGERYHWFIHSFISLRVPS